MKAAILPNQAVDILLHRDGELILTHGSGYVVIPGQGGQHGGGPISAESAEAVKKRQDCVEISSGLFPRCAQSWKLVRQKSGSVPRPGQIAPIPPMDPSAPGVRTMDVPPNPLAPPIVPPIDARPAPDVPMVEHALYYASRGWHVFPAPAGKKKSHKSAEYSGGRNWGMTTDEAEIRSDFKRWPNANVGIVTGAESDIFVVETDTAAGHGDGVDGAASLAALEAEHGPLPATLQAMSPSGSIHRYFKHPGFKIINSESVIAPGVDVRGDGGMVVAPPSVMPDRPATADKPAKPGGVYRWRNDLAIADAPQWLLDRNAPEKPKTISEQAKELIRLPGAQTSGDNFWSCVKDLALDNRSAWVPALFSDAHLRTISGRQVWRVTSQALGRDLEEDLSIAPDGIWDFGTNRAMTAIDVVMEFSSPNKTSEEAALWLCDRMGIEPESLGWRVSEQNGTSHGAEISIVPGDNPRPAQIGIPLTLFDDVENFVQKKWLIKGVIAKGETSMWCAPPGKLKSALMTDMAIHLASGADWRGYQSKDKCGVVYFALERADLVKRRLAAHRKRNDLAGLPIAVAGGIINLMDQKCVGTIVTTIREAEKAFGRSVGMVVFDTYAKGIAAGGGDENQAKDQGAAIANLRRVQEQTKVHIAIVSHTGKDEKRGARGSNAQDGDVDVMVQISGDSIKIATVTKANDQAEGVLTKFKAEITVLGTDEDGDEITTAIISADDCGSKEDKSGERARLKPSERRAMDLLVNAINDVGKPPPPAGGFPQTINRVVPLGTWRTYCKRGGLSDGDTDEAFRIAFKRVTISLANSHRIGNLDGLVWIAYDGA